MLYEVITRRHRAVNERLDSRVAWIHRGMAIGDADNGFVEIPILESDRAQHGAVGRARDALGDQAAAAVVCHTKSPGKKAAAGFGAA